MLNYFCFHVYAQKSLFKVENVVRRMVNFPTIPLDDAVKMNTLHYFT